MVDRVSKNTMWDGWFLGSKKMGYPAAMVNPKICDKKVNNIITATYVSAIQSGMPQGSFPVALR